MKTKIYRDPVVEAYMANVDRMQLRENLKLTYEQRAVKHQNALQIIEKLRHAKKHSDFLASVKTTDEVFRYAVQHHVSKRVALKKSIKAKRKKLEDASDVAWLKRIRRKPLHYRTLEDYLNNRKAT